MAGIKGFTVMDYFTMDIAFGLLRVIWLDFGSVKKMAIGDVFSGSIPNSAME